MKILPTKGAAIGLDIGHHTVKATQLDKAGEGWRVSKSATAHLPVGAVRDGIVMDTDLVANVIQQMLKDSGISGGHAYLAVSGAAVQVRHVRMPKMAESILRKSIKLEAGRYLASNTDESYVEFEIQGYVDDVQMDVMVVSAPKELVDSRIRVCDALGLHVEAVDLEAFAAYRSLVESNRGEDWGNEILALVDVGASATRVCVVDAGQFHVSRSIPVGGNVFTEALITAFKLSQENAEVGKAQLDVSELLDDSTPKENPPLRVIQPHLDDLVREIRRSLNYFQTQAQDSSKQVQRVLLTGGGAHLSGLGTYLAHKLGLPVQVVGVYQNPRFSTAAQEDTGLDMAVATGLAMRAFASAA